MCGIFFALSRHEPILPDETMVSRLCARGPDSFSVIQRSLCVNDCMFFLTFASTVLSLRGATITKQPLVCTDTNSILCWNGEIWKSDGKPVRRNDTKFVLECLCACAITQRGGEHAAGSQEPRVERILSEIEGPYAFVFFDATSSVIHFGRDSAGRRSLLVQRRGPGELLLSSVSDGDLAGEWLEVPSGVPCHLDLKGDVVWTGELSMFATPSTESSEYVHLDQPLESKAAQRRRLEDLYKSDNSAVHREARVHSLSSVGHAFLNQSLHLRLRDVPYTSSLLGAKNEGKDCNLYINKAETIGILFSGGLDCSILARLCHDIIPLDQPIALLNVAFENPRLAARHTEKAQVSTIYEACPDRITARKALDELARVCMGREWRFICINIAYNETVKYREHVISLMRPHGTEMDLSIAMALFFASRGEGQVAGSNGDIFYATPVKVLLSGLGADEIFGGYIRHENAYKRGGMEALKEEMDLDIARIGQRNLGRDDRVTANWAKEVRYPYLDEGFMQWALQLAVWDKCAFHVIQPTNVLSPFLTDLEPGKFLLRAMAKDLGLKVISKEKKRAIQFGSRSAKMFYGKTKGTDSLSVKC